MEKKIYFISDLHLGLHPKEKSLEREKIIVNWLRKNKDNIAELYLLGDVFDFWHEYKHVVPKGFTRFFGLLAEFTDDNIPVHFFIGNHDVWAYGYFTDELGIHIHYKPILKTLYNKTFYIGHGDGLLKKDYGYRVLNGAFKSKTLQWLFARLHPNAAMQFGQTWSKHSRYAKGIKAEGYLGDNKEHQVIFVKDQLSQNINNIDYYIFGHRHLPMKIDFSTKCSLINTGDWIYNFTFVVFDGNDIQLHSIFPEKEKNILYKNIPYI